MLGKHVINITSGMGARTGRKARGAQGGGADAWETCRCLTHQLPSAEALKVLIIQKPQEVHDGGVIP